MLSDIEAELEQEVRALRNELVRERRARELRGEIARLAAATSARVDRSGVGQVLTEGAVGIFDAAFALAAWVDDEAIVHLVDSSDDAQRPDNLAWSQLRLEADLPVCEVLRGERARIEIHDPSAMFPWRPLRGLCDEAGIEAMAVGRIGTGEQPDAALILAWTEPHTMDNAASEHFDLFASLSAPAFERARRTESDDELSRAVQTWLREGRLAEVERLDIATLYEPGRDLMRVGGDWFDVLELGDDCAAVVIGDVVGHDVRAAIEMSQVRHVLASQLASSGDPVTALTRTDAYLRDRASNIMATALVAAFDRDGHVSLASAGHPPAVICAPDGATRVPTLGLGPPLGTGLGGYSAHSEPIDPGEVLVAYTDGVVETRDASVDEGIAELRARLAEAIGTRNATPHGVVEMLQDLVDTAWRIDDAAAVIVRVLG